MNISVVNLNPCIDWQWTTPAFVYGGLNRAKGGAKYAAGKGINVCVALKNLGLDPLCMGFNYKENGEIITGALDTYGVRHDFVNVDGAVRVNIKLYDSAAGTMTELNQPGAFVPPIALFELHEKIKYAAGRFGDINYQLSSMDSGHWFTDDDDFDAHDHPGMEEMIPHDDILVLSGSMPAGVSVGIYEELCTDWPGMVILDADGEALIFALEGDNPPFCIKPNLYELESSFGVKLTTKEDVVAFCRKLIKKYGVTMICVSMGADGAVLVTPFVAYYMPGLELLVRGVQGAGDSMVAGLVYGLTQRMPDSELLRMATAAAAASVIREGTLMCTKEGFTQYLREVPQPQMLYS